MIKVCYSELDGPEGLSLRLEAAGHAGYAPAGQDIVCAGASTLMQALGYRLGGEGNARRAGGGAPGAGLYCRPGSLRADGARRKGKGQQ